MMKRFPKVAAALIVANAIVVLPGMTPPGRNARNDITVSPAGAVWRLPLPARDAEVREGERQDTSSAGPGCDDRWAGFDTNCLWSANAGAVKRVRVVPASSASADFHSTALHGSTAPAAAWH